MTAQEVSYLSPVQTIPFNGLLFDMDGTIIDSTQAIIKHWHKIAKELDVAPEVILATSHGRRSIDVLKSYDPKLANWEYVCHVEGQVPKEFGQDAEEIPGARIMLDSLEEQNVPWCIVTSGTRPLVSGWLDVLKLAHPKNMVTAEDVEHGKPDPTCYRIGGKKLALPNQNASMVVFEDAPAGIRAGKAAGYKVVALRTTHDFAQLKEAGADYIIKDMRSIRLKSWNRESGEGQLDMLHAPM